MDFKFDFNRRQISKIPREQIIDELVKAAKHFNYTDFSQSNFTSVANISYFTVNREFGSWENALQYLVEYFKKQNIEFKLTTRRSSYTVKEMFDEMERIWVALGHRPSRNEWARMNPKISYDSLYRYFGGWTNACLKFIEYKSGETITIDEESTASNETNFKTKVTSKQLPKNDESEIPKTRTISLSLRLKILSRDSFRCVYCGKSPATDIGTMLHIDHIKPFSKGGKSELPNLQTLCFECNLGKSDRSNVI